MPDTGLSPRKLSRVTVSGSGGIWGQILCSCFSSYVINGLWWVLSRSFVLGAVPMLHAQFLVPQLSRLTAACPVRLWSHSLLCPWVSATSRFLTTQLGALPLWFVASSKQLTWIQYFSSILPLPPKKTLCLPITTQVATLTLSSLQILHPQWTACPSPSHPSAGETFRACSVFSPSTTEQSKTNS